MEVWYMPELSKNTTTWKHFWNKENSKITYWGFTYRICMEPAEVILIVDRKSLQEISLRTQQNDGEREARLTTQTSVE